jgi:hypothetical protein
MSEPTKTPVEIIAEVLRAEGDIHSWRCEYPELYGPCTCIEETAMIIVEALIESGTCVQVVPMRELAVDGDLGVWSDEPAAPADEEPELYDMPAWEEHCAAVLAVTAGEVVVPLHPATGPGEVVHLMRDEQGITACCGRTPFELPRTDRMTFDPARRTCWLNAHQVASHE